LFEEHGNESRTVVPVYAENEYAIKSMIAMPLGRASVIKI
jgi:hypothetical protein